MQKTELILQHAGMEEYADLKELAAALASSPPVSIRHNPAKLLAVRNGAEVPWCRWGEILQERPFFAGDPLWHSGAYYVQEASSMFAGELFHRLVPEKNSIRVLDLCASPGGKSTHILDYLSSDSLLVSNEVMKARTLPLSDNIQRWGRPNVIVSSSGASDFSRLEDYFDVILADMPCSGEGMIRKDPFALEQWSPGLVSQCSLLQKQLLEEAWKALKPAGLLIYSTCTFNREENEENIRFASQFLGGEAVEKIQVPGGVVITETDGISSYRFIPGKISGEGFFVSAFRKPGSSISPAKKLRTENYRSTSAPSLLSSLAAEMNLEIFLDAENAYMLPSGMKSEADFLRNFIRIIHPGTRAGKFAGRDFIPDHALALFAGIEKYVQHFELSLDDARAYLSRETPSSVPVSEFTDKWALAAHRGLPMGWMKKAGTRINNYYPLPLRLRNNPPGNR